MTTELSIREAAELAMQVISGGEIPLLQSVPGTGKTDCAAQIASTLGWNLLTLYPAISLPEHFQGFPFRSPETGEADFEPLGLLRKLVNAKSETLCFVDEIDKANPSVQSCVAQLIQSRTVGHYHIPDCVRFMLAGNRPEDRAGGQRLVTHLTSRCFVFTVKPTAVPWLDWSAENGIHPIIRAFIDRMPQHLLDFDPRRVGQNTDPRKFEKLSNVMKAQGPGFIPSLALAEGCFSPGVAAEFTAFCRLIDELPSYDEIVADPQNATLPESPSARYAAAAMLAARGQLADAEPVAAYICRLPAEVAAFAFKSLYNRDKGFAKSQSFTKWATAHSDLFRG